ncbi:hypothetical protein [Actinoplanes sp. NPDC051494]|uniref:hypothetical protein n=1 Tax=Actinoplanes sp. NPDC051494 TaxID=3363907 RepID=UPI003790FFD8
MAQRTPESPAEFRRSNTASGVAVITAALMVGMAPFAASKAAGPAARTGSAGIAGEPPEIPLDGE